MLKIRKKMVFNNKRVLTLRELSYYLESVDNVQKYMSEVRNKMELGTDLYLLKGAYLKQFKSFNRIEENIGGTVLVLTGSGFKMLAKVIMANEEKSEEDIKLVCEEYYKVDSSWIDEYIRENGATGRHEEDEGLLEVIVNPQNNDAVLDIYEEERKHHLRIIQNLQNKLDIMEDKFAQIRAEHYKTLEDRNIWKERAQNLLTEKHELAKIVDSFTDFSRLLNNYNKKQEEELEDFLVGISNEELGIK